MRRTRKPMTVARLKKSMDRRLGRIERTMVTKKDLARAVAEMRHHFEMVAESMRDDLRIFADAIGLHSERLRQHDTRITRLEQRSF